MESRSRLREWLSSVDNDGAVIQQLLGWKKDNILMKHSLMILKQDSTEYDSAAEENRVLARPLTVTRNKKGRGRDYIEWVTFKLNILYGI